MPSFLLQASELETRSQFHHLQNNSTFALDHESVAAVGLLEPGNGLDLNIFQVRLGVGDIRASAIARNGNYECSMKLASGFVAVPSRLDVDVGPHRLLVPHPARRRRPHLLRGCLQTLRPALQPLQNLSGRISHFLYPMGPHSVQSTRCSVTFCFGGSLLAILEVFFYSLIVFIVNTPDLDTTSSQLHEDLDGFVETPYKDSSSSYSLIQWLIYSLFIYFCELFHLERGKLNRPSFFQSYIPSKRY